MDKSHKRRLDSKEDLEDYEIPSDFKFLMSMFKYGFKNLVKKEAKKYTFSNRLETKAKHSKMDYVE